MEQDNPELTLEQKIDILLDQTAQNSGDIRAIINQTDRLYIVLNDVMKELGLTFTSIDRRLKKIERRDDE